MAVWMVRAGKEGQAEELALREGVIAIGWEGLGNLAGIESRDALEDLVRERCEDATEGRIHNYVAQVWAFIQRIQVGDWALLPVKTRATVAIGRVTGGYRHRPGPGAWPACHVRSWSGRGGGSERNAR